MDLPMSFCNTFWEIYSIPKESMYTVAFLSKNNETNPMLSFTCLSSRLCTPSFMLGKLPLE